MEETEREDPQHLNQKYGASVTLLEDNDSYKDLRLELDMSSYRERFRTDFEERARLYEKSLESSVCLSRLRVAEQQDFVADLIHEFACLTSAGETNKRECLRKLESKLKQASQLELPAPLDPPSLESVPKDPPIQQPELEIDEDVVAQIYKGLSKLREMKLLERQKLVSEPAFTEPWTGIETLHLLRGIVKFGEHSWSDMCEKCHFQSFRTPNSLAYKWSKIKAVMLEDIDRVHADSGYQMSKGDWIQLCIRKLEVKDGVLMGHPSGSPGPQPESSLNCPSNSHRQGVSQWRASGHPIRGTHVLPPDRIRANRFLVQNKNVAQGEDAKGTGQFEGNRARVPLMWRGGNQESSGMATPQEFVQDRKQNAMQQLVEAYNDCVTHFNGAIANKSFIPGELKQYLAAKDVPVLPKYFAVQYAVPSQASVPPLDQSFTKALDTPTKPPPHAEPLEPNHSSLSVPTATVVRQPAGIPTTPEAETRKDPKVDPKPDAEPEPGERTGLQAEGQKAPANHQAKGESAYISLKKKYANKWKPQIVTEKPAQESSFKPYKDAKEN